MIALIASRASWTPPVTARDAFTRPESIASHRRRRSSSSRVESRRRGRHVQRLGIDVGLVEAVEEDEPVHAASRRARPANEPSDEKNGDSLTATGILTRALDGPHDLEEPSLEGDTRLAVVRAEVVEVQLDRVGAGLGDAASRT